MPAFNHSTSYSIYGNKLRKYKNDNPLFNWNKIEHELSNTNISMNDKSSIMKLFEEEWFIQDSELIVSFDLSNNTGTFLRRVWEINIPELFKATETEQTRMNVALGSVIGVAIQNFRDDYPHKDTIQVHMDRYSNQLNDRKNDFVESVLLKNTSSLKRSRTEEVKEETNHKKSLRNTEQTSLLKGGRIGGGFRSKGCKKQLHILRQNNHKQAWDMLLMERERIIQQQEDEFSRIVGIAQYCVERFKVKGNSQIRNRHEEKRKEAEEIFYTIQDLTNSLEDSHRQMREEERDPTPEEADQMASLEQRLHTQKSNLERTLPDIRSCLDTAELKNTLEESLPFEKEEINESLS